MSDRPNSVFRPAARPLLAMGGLLLAAAGFCFARAFEHMVALGQICGGAAAHCDWCGATDLLAAAGIASLALGIRARRPQAAA